MKFPLKTMVRPSVTDGAPGNTSNLTGGLVPGTDQNEKSGTAPRLLAPVIRLPNGFV